MEIYLPTLEEKIVGLVTAFRFIVFAIMVVGLVAYAARGNLHGAQLFGTIAKAIVIVAAIAYMNLWFPQVEKVFLNVAEYIDPGYNADPTSASQAIWLNESGRISRGYENRVNFGVCPDLKKIVGIEPTLRRTSHKVATRLPQKMDRN